MRFGRRLRRDEKGVAIIEMAFALPILIVMIWIFVQLAQVYRAVAGIQQALGEGARFATLCVNPSNAGCESPTADEIKTRINDAVYGIGPGSFDVPTPSMTVSGSSKYYDLVVNYTQPTNMLLFPGPTITVSRSKRVWVAGN
jgi:Flp pilus assembly pilin Flp